MSPALAGRLSTTAPPGKPLKPLLCSPEENTKRDTKLDQIIPHLIKAVPLNTLLPNTVQLQKYLTSVSLLGGFIFSLIKVVRKEKNCAYVGLLVSYHGHKQVTTNLVALNKRN